MVLLVLMVVLMVLVLVLVLLLVLTLLQQVKFPSGLKSLADWLHARGLKLGVVRTPAARALPLVATAWSCC